MQAKLSETSDELRNLEPHKCEGWEWVTFEELTKMHQENPGLMFDPLARFIEEGSKPVDV